MLMNLCGALAEVIVSNAIRIIVFMFFGVARCNDRTLWPIPRAITM
ncbi:hypothetical protein M2333_001823 [Sphingobium sp. B11D3B]|nr:hypothetical protein [Sphingobium sp. B11D3B]